ncbi:hypothetical protein ACLIA0_13120 [Bacillaceae bacterium W0354]
MMEFLYFPDNKLEYIPAVFSLIIVVIIAILLMRLIRNASNKERERFEAQFPEAKLQDNDSNDTEETKKEN